jgi:hypothetical protein
MMRLGRPSHGAMGVDKSYLTYDRIQLIMGDILPHVEALPCLFRI